MPLAKGKVKPLKGNDAEIGAEELHEVREGVRGFANQVNAVAKKHHMVTDVKKAVFQAIV